MKRIPFDEGMLIDFDDPKPLSATDVDRIDAYDLHFIFRRSSSGLKAFHFKVVADKSGTIIAPLELPNIARAPAKANLKSCEKAVDLIVAGGVPRDTTSITFRYDEKTDTFVWDVTDGRPVEPDEEGVLALLQIGQGTFRHFYVDANTGKIIRTFNETIVL